MFHIKNLSPSNFICASYHILIPSCSDCVISRYLELTLQFSTIFRLYLLLNPILYPFYPLFIQSSLFESSLTFSMSPKSFTVSKSRGPAEASSQVALENLPPEIKDQIFSYLPQADLSNLLFTSPSFTEAITIKLYYKPKFPTTYRFAQFVTTVSHSKRYANLVKILDIPGSCNPWSNKSNRATWREWKYRDQPLYAAQYPSLFSAKRRSCYRSHPTRCPFMKFENDNILPIGAVVHVLMACQNIRSL